jgi:predicted amidophosphoribosyltransferase
MKKSRPIYLVVVLIALFISGISISLVFLSSSAVSMVLPVILIITIVVIFLFAANYLSSGALEKRMEIYLQCPQCGKETETNGKYCKHCGTNLTLEVICEYCGHKNKLNELICQNCNANLK